MADSQATFDFDSKQPKLGPRAEDLTGRSFNRWTFISFDSVRKGRIAYWKVECECGTIKVRPATQIVNGYSRSCGCVRDESNVRRFTKHGMYKSREYAAWDHIKARCYNPNNKKFHLYGGRGITVCQRWLDSFENFLTDMGLCPEGMSIDRFPNRDGNYEPNNCRWATDKEQNRNTNRNNFVTFNGETRAASEWAELRGWPRNLVNTRLREGWSVERALTEPWHKKPTRRA